MRYGSLTTSAADSCPPHESAAYHMPLGTKARKAVVFHGDLCSMFREHLEGEVAAGLSNGGAAAGGRLRSGICAVASQMACDDLATGVDTA